MNAGNPASVIALSTQTVSEISADRLKKAGAPQRLATKQITGAD